MKINRKIGLASIIGLVGSGIVIPATSHAGLLNTDNLTSNMQNVYMNVTPGKTYQTEDGGKLLTTTSLYFRFGNEFETYEPIFHISPLSVSAGCNGFSIKGMFMSILGIDRIQEMLKSSATSFAYGIVVGLIYTMPGIFHSFQMLNQWAKKIQELMNNACKSGIEVGKQISETFGMTGFGKTLEEYTDFIPSPEGVIESIDKTASSIYESLGFSMSDANSNLDKQAIMEPTENNHIPTEEVEDILARAIGEVKVFNSNATAVMYSIMTGDGNTYNSLNEFFCKNLKDSTACNVVSDLAESSSIPSGVAINSGYFGLTYAKNNSAQHTYSINTFLKDNLHYTDDILMTKFLTLTRTAIQKAILGDVVLSDANRLTEVMSVIQKIVKARKDGGFSNTIEKDEVAEEVNSFTKGNSQIMIFQKETKPFKNTTAMNIGKGLAVLMIGDTEDSTGSNGLDSLKGMVPVLPYKYVVFPEYKNAHNSVSVSLFALPGRQSKSSFAADSFFEDMTVPSKSLYEVSLEIARRLTERSAAETTQSIIENESKNLGNGDFDIPWIVPKFFIYAKVAQQSIPGDREEAIKKLAQYNTCAVALTAINIFERTNIYGQGKLAYAYSFIDGHNTNDIVLAKINAVTRSEGKEIFKKTSDSNEKVWKYFMKGFKSKLSQIIQAESFADDSPDKALYNVCNKKELDGYFQNLDYKNRRRAASQVDSAK